MSRLNRRIWFVNFTIVGLAIVLGLLNILGSTKVLPVRGVAQDILQKIEHPAHASYQPVCTPRTYTVGYTDNAFKVASVTATKTLLTLASNRVKLCGATLDPKTSYAWTATDAGTPTMACALGSATSGNSAIYLPSLNVMQTAESVSQGGLFGGKDLATPDTNLAIVLTCTGSTNFGTGSATHLTAGKVWVTVYTSTLPAGS